MTRFAVRFPFLAISGMGGSLPGRHAGRHGRAAGAAPAGGRLRGGRPHHRGAGAWRSAAGWGCLHPFLRYSLHPALCPCCVSCFAVRPAGGRLRCSTLACAASVPSSSSQPPAPPHGTLQVSCRAAHQLTSQPTMCRSRRPMPTHSSRTPLRMPSRCGRAWLCSSAAWRACYACACYRFCTPAGGARHNSRPT